MEQKSLENLEFGKILAIVAAFAGSRAAKERILSLCPSVDANQISLWLSEIDELLDYSQAGVKINSGGLRDIREIIEILQSGSTILGSDDFLKVKANIEVAAAMKKVFDARATSWGVKGGSRLAARIRGMPALPGLFLRIDDCLDDRGQVRSDASPALASIRREYTQTVSNTEKQLAAFLSHHADDVQDRYFTMRNERYVVPVLASAQSRIQGIIHDQSSTGQTLFIEPLSFLPANNRLAQLRMSEREEIRRIFTSLTSLLYQSLSSLAKARAEFAVKYDASRPEINEKSDLLLNSARHPLIHPDCVPLDIKMNSEQRCIIITGPNGGGKTVALKTVGINALLMQTGNYVLAAKDAKLPVFRQILSDIGESQSIEDHLSTFTAHLKRLREMAELADGRSLVLIDEICVGTDPVEGGALASGFLKELSSRGAFSVVTSHYDSLKHVAFTTPGFINAAMEFDYETFKPTFRFQIGIPGKSNALAMARVFGLPESVLQDLVRVNSGERQDEKGLIEAIERERNRAEALRRTYVQKIAGLRAREQEVEESLQQLREFRKTRRDKLTEEFTVELRARLKDIESLINRLRRLAEGGAVDEKALAEAREAHASTRKLLEKLQQDAQEEIKPENTEAAALVSCRPEDFRPGVAIVWKLNLRRGTLIRYDSARARAEVEIDGKILRVRADELALATAGQKREEKNAGAVYAVRPLVRSDLDVRGMRVEEAVDEVEAYLKVASETELGKVFIIHGKGTGALQKAITAYLKSSPWKNRFRSGRYGEGDMGVTVVVFKPESDKDEDPTLVLQHKFSPPKGGRNK
jgi:DNA mismatch repair protein MutS2